MQSTIGLRLAKGNRFDHIIDSYAYALGMASDDIYEAEKGRAMAIETFFFMEHLLAMAKRQGYTKEQLGITTEEEIFIASHEAVVLVEDEHGRVETEWLENVEDAGRMILFLQELKHLDINSLANSGRKNA